MRYLSTYLRCLLCISHFVWAGTCIAQTPTNLTQQAERLHQLGQQARQMLNRQQPDSAWLYAIKPGLALLKRLPESDSAHRFIRQVATTYYYGRRDFANTIRELNTLIRLSQVAKDTVHLVKSRYKLSIVYSNLGLNQQAIAQSLAMLRLLPKGDKPMDLSSAYAMLSANYQELGDSARAAYYTDLTLAYARLNRDKNPGWALLVEAEQRGDAKKYALAIQQLRQFIRVQAQQHTRESVTYAQLKIAQYYKQANQLGQARQVVEKAIQSARQDHELTAESEAYTLLADIWQQQGEPKRAIPAARQAVALAWQSGHIILRPAALKALANAQERAGEYQNALRTTHQFRHLTDSLNGINKIEIIAVAQATFDVEQKDSQIKLLNKNVIINELKQKQQSIFGWGIIIALGIGVALTYFFLRRSQQQKREIETQARQLTELNGIKDRLFAIVSHDLRGPVAGLNNAIARIRTRNELAQPLSTADWHHHLNLFSDQAGQITTLTDNLLYWSLMQMKGIKTAIQEVYLVDQLQPLLNLYGLQMAEKQIRLLIEDALSADEFPPIFADEQHVQIVLRNIVHNAIKFSPVGGEIRCSAQADSDTVTVCVSDEGPGFRWPPNAPNAKQDPTGTGLGLIVVENLMAESNGQFRVEPRTDTTGTNVWLRWSRIRPLSMVSAKVVRSSVPTM